MTATQLVLDGITVQYGEEAVLDDLSLTLDEGQRLVITGPNGAGKTTLLDVITGIRRLNHGRIIWYGRDITKLPTYRRARLGIARQWQHPSLCDSLTVAENLSIALRTRPNADRRTNIDTALQGAGLEDLKHSRARTLSTGQRRRVELAAAALSRPRLLLLDEPSAGLDQPAYATAVAQIHRHCPTTSMIIVEHNVDAAARIAGCFRVARLASHSRRGGCLIPVD